MIVKDYLEEALEAFAKDPADTDYQRGYEAALRELAEFLDSQPA